MTQHKVKSGNVLRERLAMWCASQGGIEMEPPGFNSCVNYVLGGTWRVPLDVGALLVHLPADNDYGLTINTRFIDGAKLPSNANQYSGKWNFTCYSDANYLFRMFARCFEAYKQSINKSFEVANNGS